MIKENTVLILGAGASMPFGFPSGKQLVRLICDMLDTLNSPAWVMMNKLGHPQHQVKKFVTALSRSGQTSIDAFLEHRPEFVIIGKQMIAIALLPYERTDAIFDKPWKKGNPNWYEHFFSMLNTSFGKFGQNELSIITFNYDRSLEHYLHTVLCNSHGISSRSVKNELSNIPIVHVHGQLGHLPWQSREGVVLFGSANDKEIIRIAANKIKIIHDDVDDDPEFIEAQKLIRQARHIYFLGFGYNETNLKRLGGPEIFESSNAEILGTGVNLSRTQRRIAAKYMGAGKDSTGKLSPYAGDFLEENSTCHDLIYNKVDLIE